MIIKNAYKNVTWIDITSPSKDEIREITNTYRLDKEVADELLAPTDHPRVERHRSYIYTILHFPAFKHSHGSNRNQEVNFIIGQNFLITVRYDMIDPIHKFTKVFEVNSLLDHHQNMHTGFVLFHMLQKLYRSLEHELDYINDHLEEIEQKIFSGHEREMVSALSGVNRNALLMKHTLRLHEDILVTLGKALHELFGDSYKEYVEQIQLDYQHIMATLEAHREVLQGLYETNMSLLSTKQNEIMKILTIMAFVTFPLSLIAGVFGMNTKFMPLVGGPNDFWLVISIMLILTVLFFLYFRYKRWL